MALFLQQVSLSPFALFENLHYDTREIFMIENRELTIAERVKDLSLSDSERVKKWGHRAYIGGPNEKSWYENGRRQYHFLISRGLKPYHVFFDIACGSLRLGQ